VLSKRERIETLLERADAAVYQAEKNSRNCVAVAEDFGTALKALPGGSSSSC